MIETINTHSRPAFYVGRVIAGLGLGSATVIVPMFSSEMMPKEIRGKVGCFLQLSFTCKLCHRLIVAIVANEVSRRLAQLLGRL